MVVANVVSYTKYLSLVLWRWQYGEVDAYEVSSRLKNKTDPTISAYPSCAIKLNRKI